MYIIYSVRCKHLLFSKHFTLSVVRTTLTVLKLYRLQLELLCQLCTLLTRSVAGSVVNIYYSVGCTPCQL